MAISFQIPVNAPYRITSYHDQPIWYGKHRGVDIIPDGRTVEREPVYCPADGILIEAGRHWQGGNRYTIQHNFPGYSVQSWMAHFDELPLKKGQYVKKGQYLGPIGNTGLSRGAHLHWHTYVNGVVTNPLTYLEDTPMNIIARITNAFVEQMRNPKAVYIIVPGVGEFLVKDSRKRKITSVAATKDFEAMKSIFGVFVSKADADKIENGPDL